MTKTKLARVENGYAEVLNETGRRIGTVRREKFGSTRTGTRWIARRFGQDIGYRDTRGDAVKLLEDRVAKIAAQINAFNAGA